MYSSTRRSRHLTDEDHNEDLSFLSTSVRYTGVAMASILIISASLLAVWVMWNRNAPVIKAMQPIFLILLCLGMILSLLAVVPDGANSNNTSNINAACMAHIWLSTMGSTVTLSALFSKLWRVNQIFLAQRFQRKVVTVKDVLRPFGILLGLNVIFLTTQAIVDPPVWHEPEPSDTNSTNLSDRMGYCGSNGVVGSLMHTFSGLVNFVALIVMCVQAYKGREVRSEFSEARGVALALFSKLQAIIIIFPLRILIEQDNVDAQYFLNVLTITVPTMAMQFFVFAPVIAHHRAFQRGDVSQLITGAQHVTGLQIGNSTVVVEDLLKQAQTRIASLEGQLQQLQSRNNENNLEYQAGQQHEKKNTTYTTIETESSPCDDDNDNDTENQK